MVVRLYEIDSLHEMLSTHGLSNLTIGDTNHVFLASGCRRSVRAHWRHSAADPGSCGLVLRV